MQAGKKIVGNVKKIAGCLFLLGFLSIESFFSFTNNLRYTGFALSISSASASTTPVSAVPDITNFGRLKESKILRGKGTGTENIYYCVGTDNTGSCRDNLTGYIVSTVSGDLKPALSSQSPGFCCAKVNLQCKDDNDCKQQMWNAMGQENQNCQNVAHQAIMCCHQPSHCPGATFTQITDLVAGLSQVFSQPMSISQQCKRAKRTFGLMGVKSGILATQCKTGASTCSNTCRESEKKTVDFLGSKCGIEGLWPVFERHNFSVQNLSIRDPNFHPAGVLRPVMYNSNNNSEIYKELDELYENQVHKVTCSYEFFRETYQYMLNKTNLFYAAKVCTTTAEQSNVHIGNVVENMLKSLAMQAANCKDQAVGHSTGSPGITIPTTPPPPDDQEITTVSGGGGCQTPPCGETTSTPPYPGVDLDEGLFDLGTTNGLPPGPKPGGPASGLVGPRGGGGGGMGGGGGGGGGGGRGGRGGRKGSPKGKQILLGTRSGKFAGYGGGGGAFGAKNQGGAGPWSKGNAPKKRLASLDLKKLLPKDKKLGHLDKAFGSPHDNIFQRVTHRMKWMCQTKKISCRK